MSIVQSGNPVPDFRLVRGYHGIPLKSDWGHTQLHQERAKLHFLVRIVRRGGLWGGVRDSKDLGRFLATRVLGQGL